MATTGRSSLVFLTNSLKRVPLSAFGRDVLKEARLKVEPALLVRVFDDVRRVRPADEERAAGMSVRFPELMIMVLF
jgi:hypothetical protein